MFSFFNLIGSFLTLSVGTLAANTVRFLVRIGQPDPAADP